MSYQLHFIRSTEASDLAQLVASQRFDPSAIGEADPAKEARKRRIAERLRALSPELEPFRLDYPRIAISQGISEDEARRRFRHIELDGPKLGSGIHLTLFDDTAALTIPYWHEGARATKVLQEIWEYLPVFEQEGFRAYDPQLVREVHAETDLNVVKENYCRLGKRFLPGTAEARRPWWKFW